MNGNGKAHLSPRKSARILWTVGVETEENARDHTRKTNI